MSSTNSYKKKSKYIKKKQYISNIVTKHIQTPTYSDITTAIKGDNEFLKISNILYPIIEVTKYGYKIPRISKLDDNTKIKTLSVGTRMILEKDTTLINETSKVIYNTCKLIIKKANCCIFKGGTILIRNSGNFTNCVFQDCTIICKGRSIFTNCYFQDKSIKISYVCKFRHCHFKNVEHTTNGTVTKYKTCHFDSSSLNGKFATIIISCSNIETGNSTFINCVIHINTCNVKTYIIFKYCNINLTGVNWLHHDCIAEFLHCTGSIHRCSATIEELKLPIMIKGGSLDINFFHIHTKSMTIKPIMYIKSATIECNAMTIGDWPEVSIIIESSIVYFTNLDIASNKSVICVDSTVHFFNARFGRSKINPKLDNYGVDAENSNIKLIKCNSMSPIKLDNSTCICVSYVGSSIMMKHNSMTKFFNTKIEKLHFDDNIMDYKTIFNNHRKVSVNSNTCIIQKITEMNLKC